MKITSDMAKRLANRLELKEGSFNLEQFRRGIEVEMEHGDEFGEKTNVTKNDLLTTARIALAHLMEIPDYYTRLDKMEQEYFSEHAK